MKLAVGSDEKTLLTDFVVEQLRKEGHQLELIGPLKGEPMGWPDVGEKVAVEVSSGRADQGIVFCWTGTGVSIAANKVSGSELPSAATRRLLGGLDCGMTRTYWR